MAGENLLLLFERPNEPIFLPKGDKDSVFNVPDDYLDDTLKGSGIVNRFGDSSTNRIDVKPITLPDFSIPLQLGKNEKFSLFIPHHRRCAGRLIETFMGLRNLEDLESSAVYCRQHMNPLLFNYCLSVAILHRPDTRHLDIPPLTEIFPDRFMDGKIFAQARQEAAVGERVPGIASNPLEIPLDYTASDLEEEHRVAYFREDVGVNLHHWHWHLVYPFTGPRNIVAKDRRGEIFYYMHAQIIGRYNFERLCNKLSRVKKFTEWRDPMPEGYFPKMDSLSSSRVWPSRPPNTKLSNIIREADQIVFDISDLENWRDRLYEAAETGQIMNAQGQMVQLNETEGIDILANLAEASILSANPNLYGDLHNLGHIAIALSHDPEHKHLETFGVMGDLATVMRDPIFYRWHLLIDDIFVRHKNTLTPYTVQQLQYNGLRVASIEVNSSNSPKNQFTTFWQQSDVNLTRGLDFSPRGNVFARLTHLQHEPFEYTIQVNNSGQQRQGTVRIFLAPAADERGLPFLFRDQRRLMIEMDRFVWTFRPNNNTIKRRSKQSTVIIPFEKIFRSLENAPSNATGLAEFNYCGCGWPEHLLVPKGTPEGTQAILFVMVSDYEGDRIEETGQRQDRQCDGAPSYCGIRDQKYPDRRPMGYPFDRQPRNGVDTLQQFLLPNMITQDVVIKFTGEPTSNRNAGSGQNPAGQAQPLAGQGRPPAGRPQQNQQHRPGPGRGKPPKKDEKIYFE